MNDLNQTEVNSATSTEVIDLSKISDIAETINPSPYSNECIQETNNANGEIIYDQIVKDINKDKPWRQIIKRRCIDGGSNYEDIH